MLHGRNASGFTPSGILGGELDWEVEIGCERRERTKAIQLGRWEERLQIVTGVHSEERKVIKRKSSMAKLF